MSNIFAPNSMSDLSFTQTTQHMRRFEAAQDCRHNVSPIWEVAARNNKKPLVVRRHKCKDPSYFAGC